MLVETHQECICEYRRFCNHISTLGNAADFGDLTLARGNLGAFSNSVRGSL